MEAQIEEIRKEVRLTKKEVRLTKWITIGGAMISIACRFIAPHPSPPVPTPASNSNSVQIGEAPASLPSGRDFLNVNEVAAREGLSPRTITDYIATGRMDPPPTRNGTRPWAIAADYRILPLTAANSGGE